MARGIAPSTWRRRRSRRRSVKDQPSRHDDWHLSDTAISSTLAVLQHRARASRCHPQCQRRRNGRVHVCPVCVHVPPPLPLWQHRAKGVTFAQRAPGIQMNVLAIDPNALPLNITPSSSPGTLSTSILYDCWPSIKFPFFRPTNGTIACTLPL